jgi:hypothetical protein
MPNWAISQRRIRKIGRQRKKKKMMMMMMKKKRKKRKNRMMIMMLYTLPMAMERIIILNSILITTFVQGLALPTGPILSGAWPKCCH